MRIDGGWYLFDDEVERPIILGEALVGKDIVSRGHRR